MRLVVLFCAWVFEHQFKQVLFTIYKHPAA